MVEEFFHLHGNTQASAMCLILATRPNREVCIFRSLLGEFLLLLGGSLGDGSIF